MTVAVHDYRVAAYPLVRGHRPSGDAPEGKIHAYLLGAKTTVCGFGLAEMRQFKHLAFRTAPPRARCTMCDLRVRAVDR